MIKKCPCCGSTRFKRVIGTKTYLCDGDKGCCYALVLDHLENMKLISEEIFYSDLKKR